MARSFLVAEWRNLLMANYPIDPAVLQKHLPCGTELDFFNDTCFVSLVGFLFKDTRLLGIPIPFHQTFEEVNLRFYVRYKEAGAWKRGVVFMKEIVPRRMISFVANTVYGEKYATYPMKHSWLMTEQGFEVSYQWKVRGEWNHMRALTEKENTELVPGSEEEFITEHYWGYTHVNDRCTGVYEVAHPRWKVHKVLSHSIHCNAAYLYGPQFAEALQQPPSSVFLAEGSAIRVMPGSRIYLPQKTTY